MVAIWTASLAVQAARSPDRPQPAARFLPRILITQKPLIPNIVVIVLMRLSRKIGGRDERWSEAIAVGDFTFVHKVKSELGFKAMHRRVMDDSGTHTPREESAPYSASFAAESKALTCLARKPDVQIFFGRIQFALQVAGKFWHIAHHVHQCTISPMETDSYEKFLIH